MTLFRYFLGRPWLYILAGMALLVLTTYSFYDVSRGGSISPFEKLPEYSGHITHLKTLGETTMQQDGDGQEVKIYFYELTVSLVEHPPEEAQKVWRIYTQTPLQEGAQVTARVAQEGRLTKVYHLVADNTLVVDYKDMARLAAEKALKSKNALTHPIFLSFMGLLFFGGVAGAWYEKRQHAKALKQQEKMTKEMA